MVERAETTQNHVEEVLEKIKAEDPEIYAQIGDKITEQYTQIMADIGEYRNELWKIPQQNMEEFRTKDTFLFTFGQNPEDLDNPKIMDKLISSETEKVKKVYEEGFAGSWAKMSNAQLMLSAISMDDSEGGKTLTPNEVNGLSKLLSAYGGHLELNPIDTPQAKAENEYSITMNIGGTSVITHTKLSSGGRGGK